MPNSINPPTRYIRSTLTYLAPDATRLQKRNSGFARLPFVFCSKAGIIKSYWALPATGGYVGGYEAGRLMAQAYIKQMSESAEHGDAFKLLLILEELDSRLLEANNHHQSHNTPACDLPHEVSSLRGQRIGFINELGSMLFVGSRLMPEPFAAQSESSIVQQANSALQQTKESTCARLDKQINAARLKAREGDQ